MDYQKRSRNAMDVIRVFLVAARCLTDIPFALLFHIHDNIITWHILYTYYYYKDIHTEHRIRGTIASPAGHLDTRGRGHLNITRVSLRPSVISRCRRPSVISRCRHPRMISRCRRPRVISRCRRPKGDIEMSKGDISYAICTTWPVNILIIP